MGRRDLWKPRKHLPFCSRQHEKRVETSLALEKISWILKLEEILILCRCSSGSLISLAFLAESKYIPGAVNLSTHYRLSRTDWQLYLKKLPPPRRPQIEIHTCGSAEDKWPFSLVGQTKTYPSLKNMEKRPVDLVIHSRWNFEHPNSPPRILVHQAEPILLGVLRTTLAGALGAPIPTKAECTLQPRVAPFAIFNVELRVVKACTGNGMYCVSVRFEFRDGVICWLDSV